ncbi:MAG: hypothetical protein M1827_005070 [Pycnora praestabilis]|nr:MAG: hypothetical protein M1827_005070 [Pycnora praestabilis]
MANSRKQSGLGFIRRFVEEQRQGKVWTDWLCKGLGCDRHDNFARSLPYTFENGYDGAIVDNELLNRTSVVSDSPTPERLPDLKMQVDQWIQYEEHRIFVSHEERDFERNNTVFTVSFGVWDIWHYSLWERDASKAAVMTSMAILFEQLNILARYRPGVKVILPTAVDPTFLPGWHRIRKDEKGRDISVEVLHNAIFLVDLWNQELKTRFSHWDRGTVHVFDTGTWFIKQIRDRQLLSMNLDFPTRAASSVKKVITMNGPWDEVSVPCVHHGEKNHPIEAEVNGDVPTCETPERYLFWDDVSLGPTAHKLIGTKLSELIKVARWQSEIELRSRK